MSNQQKTDVPLVDPVTPKPEPENRDKPKEADGQEKPPKAKKNRLYDFGFGIERF